jgi:hypothetical protein
MSKPPYATGRCLCGAGRHVTGFSDMHADLSGKYVQFASELGEPQATVNYLWYTEWADGQYRLQATERVPQSLGVKLRSRGIGMARRREVLVSAVPVALRVDDRSGHGGGRGRLPLVPIRPPFGHCSSTGSVPPEKIQGPLASLMVLPDDEQLLAGFADLSVAHAGVQVAHPRRAGQHPPKMTLAPSMRGCLVLAPKPTCRHVCFMVAIGGKADVARTGGIDAIDPSRTSASVSTNCG